MAEIVKNSDKSLSDCAKYLRLGKLVSFPTETVYGLGASLWNEQALLNIFKAKERPITDPLIVHVRNKRECRKLISLNKFQSICFNILAKKFWPGALTLVVTASKIVPKSVMAGGDFVGLRVPSHPTAQKLLNLCKFPIAAPSANKFGHISPTSAQHVFDDLKDVQNLYIIENQKNCEIGIESTVIKIEKEGIIKLLRPGVVSISEIEKELKKHGVTYKTEVKKNYVSRETIRETIRETKNVSRETFQDAKNVSCETNQNVKNVSRETLQKHICETSQKQIVEIMEKSKMFHVKHLKSSHNQNVSRETIGDESPGQNLTHYSPWIDTYIFIDNKKDVESDLNIQTIRTFSLDEIKRASILDFGKKHVQFKKIASSYKDLSEEGNFKEAAHNLFNMLRESEREQDACTILITLIFPDTEIAIALFDRIYRAASGKFAIMESL